MDLLSRSYASPSNFDLVKSLHAFIVEPVLGDESRALDDVADHTALYRRKRRWTSLLLISCVSGATLGLAGLAASLISIARFSEYDQFSNGGVILLIAALILITISAHCLDQIDRVALAIRKKSLDQKLFLHKHHAERKST
jgi:hypothetical protein